MKHHSPGIQKVMLQDITKSDCQRSVSADACWWRGVDDGGAWGSLTMNDGNIGYLHELRLGTTSRTSSLPRHLMSSSQNFRMPLGWKRYTFISKALTRKTHPIDFVVCDSIGRLTSENVTQKMAWARYLSLQGAVYVGARKTCY